VKFTHLLTPRRIRGVELLDDPEVSPEIMTRSMSDVERANVVFGGLHAALAEIAPALDDLPNPATLLDIGTGAADIPANARTLAARSGIILRTVGYDSSEVLLRRHRERHDAVVVGHALDLPFRDRSVDIVMCSQVLHHFREPEGRLLISEMNRVARTRVVISDLRRSLIAAGGFWMASFVLGFHSVTRHDGSVSVMRGFLPRELAALVESVIAETPVVHRRRGFRLTTSWRPR
jgi:ubiquinone/menaquinone biosynthesis C-methylase UbiE